MHTRRIEKSILSAILIFTSLASAQILWQPYNFIDANNPGTGIYIRWKTASAATIYFGESDLNQSRTGDTLGVHLTGLIPGARYHYKVVCNGDTSIPGSFRTAPPAGIPFCYVVMADIHSNAYEGINERIDECYKTYAPDLLIYAGDITDGPADWISIFSANPDVYANTIFIPARGNHDEDGVRNGYSYICSVLPDKGSNYMFTYGSATFIVSSGNNALLKNYCDSIREENGFKISIQHWAPYISTASDAETYREALLFENAGGQLWYSGHVHGYSKSSWINTSPIEGVSPLFSAIQKDSFAMYMSLGCYANYYAHVTVDSVAPGVLFDQGIRSSTTETTTGTTFVFDSFYVRTTPPLPINKAYIRFTADKSGNLTGETSMGFRNTSDAIPSVTVTPDSVWLNVNVTGTDKDQIIHHSISANSLPSGLYSTQVHVSEAGHVDAIYTVLVRIDSAAGSKRIAFSPLDTAVLAGTDIPFRAQVLDQFDMPFPAGLSWTVSGGGTIDSTGLFKSNGDAGEFILTVSVKDNPSVTNRTSIKITGGVKYETFTNFGAFSVDSINGRVPTSTGVIKNFILGMQHHPDSFAVRFTGRIDIPADGSYTFYTSSADGSKLYVDGLLVVDNDGLHGTIEKSGTVTLTQGKHAIEVRFFIYKYGEKLTVSWSGIDFIKQAIPDMILSHDDSTNISEKNMIPMPKTFAIKAFPNPFASFSDIQLAVPHVSDNLSQPFSVRIFDLHGRLVRTLFNKSLKPGYFTIRFSKQENGSSLVNGVYLCQIKGNKINQTLKLLKIR